MFERRKPIQPDPLFVNSSVSGDMETVTVSTKPLDMGPQVAQSARPKPAPVLETQPDAIRIGRFVFPPHGAPMPELLPAEELQRDEYETGAKRWQGEALTMAGSFALFFILSAIVFYGLGFA